MYDGHYFIVPHTVHTHTLVPIFVAVLQMVRISKDSATFTSFGTVNILHSSPPVCTTLPVILRSSGLRDISLLFFIIL